LAVSYTDASTSEASTGCHWLDMTTITEETVEATRDALMAQGWYSDPTDGMEALWSPECLMTHDT
jgi:hypothetical protein